MRLLMLGPFPFPPLTVMTVILITMIPFKLCSCISAILYHKVALEIKLRKAAQERNHLAFTFALNQM